MMDWVLLTIIIVLLSFSLSALMIVLSRAFSNKGLEQWAKGEMVFAVSTFFLAVFFIALFTEGNSIAFEAMKALTIENYAQQGITITPAQFDVMFPVQGERTMIRLAEVYMGSTYSCLREISQYTYAISAPFFFGESFTKDFFMADVLSGWGLKPITQTATNIMNYAVFTALLFRIFQQMLEFVAATALPIFLPVGILLRAFPPTRGSGAYVLAFVMGFYFVFPLAYLMVVNLSLNPFVCGIPDTLPNMPNTCSMSEPGRAEEIFLWDTAHFTEVLGALEKIMERGLNGVFINLCSLPFLAMVITMSFILSTTNLFGANLPEVGRGFVKLI
ncbi:MAG: hypothetical protein WC350_05740 [Candidatus Micrarchaeia archaeon]